MDWKIELEKYKQQMVADLCTLMEINSEFDESTRSEDFPFGEGPKKALDAFLELGNRDGFLTKNVDNYAGHIEFGEGDEIFGILGHMDVVPAGSGWATPAYTPTVIDGKLFGRGSQDDKGPMIASYYAIKMIKDLGLPVSKKVRIITGTDEEIGSRCVAHYFTKEKMPDFGVSPDAAFPVVYTEKGICDLKISGEIVDRVILSFEGGVKSNMVPESAKAVVNANIAVLIPEFNKYLESHDVTGTITTGDCSEITIIGKSAHSSTPEHGKNALSLLAQFLYNAHPSPVSEFLVKYFAMDNYGVKIGWNFGNSDSGVLTSNLSIVNYTDSKIDLLCNTRIPEGFPKESRVNDLKARLSSQNLLLDFGKNMDPLYIDKNDKLIQTLMEAYKNYTGDEISQPLVMGGATYAHEMKNTVAFGMLFPDTVDRMHQKDEYVVLEELFTATAIYAEAYYNLIK